jgi:hypothetical protein
MQPREPQGEPVSAAQARHPADSEELLLLDLSARLLPLRRDGDADSAVHLPHAANPRMELMATSHPAIAGPPHPIQVVGDGGHGLIVTVQASDVNLDLHTTARTQVVKKALRKAIEPVTGDAVFVERLGDRHRRPGESGLEGLGAPVTPLFPCSIRRICASNR